MRQNGFTVIEMLLVLIIAGILLSVAAIQFNRWTEKYNIESQVKQMYADLMEARIRAMGSNRFRFVTLGATNYSIYDDTNYDGVLETATDTLVLQQSLKNQITMIPATITQISFDQDGLAVVNTAIYVANNTVGAVYDCVSVTQTKIGMGKMNGTNCALQ